MKSQLRILLTETIQCQNPYLDMPVDLSQGDDSELYSDTGQLDSLSLVTIIADIEQRLFTLLGIKVHLANEQDLSVENSPFNTFGHMVSFIEEKVREAMEKTSM
ncbi:hypothetical protein [Xenorhabdus bovienii]|uniref:Carrier domain-containing protein n=1 Tax=Xenorhabdus bovienii str. Intermedium TaxID=1379677 RepID=A0A077QBU4_XENBV|nr:hypothetical protein [Xenorhabdus bovienii]CDH30869.1 conserved hypothetical protein [Xenorhabdus bovienii str. Intermedium]